MSDATSIGTVRISEAETAAKPEQPSRPPLYEADGQGGWRCNAAAYDEESAGAWMVGEYMRCAKDPAYFITTWCCAINANLDVDDGAPPAIEVIPDWPHVRALISAFFPARDVLVEKSRDMLASWIAMAAVLHDLVFRRSWATMTLSRVESLVDDGGEASTVDSLHGKVRFMWEHLPKFLRRHPLEFKHLSIRNPMTATHVKGFSATPSAGRGPKWRRAILDEFAWIPNSQQVMTSVARACPTGKALISTPRGKGNAFYQIRATASRGVYPKQEAKRGHFERFTIHWSQHPHRDEAWYRREIGKGAMTAEAVAQELDISYDRSVTGRVYPKFVFEQHVAEMPIPYDPRRPLWLAMDFNHDPLVWEIVQPYQAPPQYRVIGEICRRNATYEDAVREFIVRFGDQSLVDGWLSANPQWVDLYGGNGICVAGPEGHTAEVVIFGDATEEKSTVYNRTKMYGLITGMLREAGFHVSLQVPPGNPPVVQRLETVNDALSKGLLLIAPTAEQLIKDFESGTWDSANRDMAQREDDDGTGLSRSHASSALGYMLVRRHRLATSAERPRTVARAQDILALIRKW